MEGSIVQPVEEFSRRLTRSLALREGITGGEVRFVAELPELFLLVADRFAFKQARRVPPGLPRLPFTKG